MKGVINKGIQEMAETQFGVQAWEKIKEIAGCKEPFFSISEDYPDQMTFDLAGAAAQALGIPLETVLVEFGKFWVMNTGKRSYPTFFKLAGSSAREFLLNMDRVHQQATRSVANAHPPSFQYEEMPDGRLLMHYKSERRLCPVLRGLILGVGLNFGQNLQVNEIACMNKGDDQCTMEIIFP